MRAHFLALALAAVLMALSLPVAIAAGGICFDDFSITNGGGGVFSDSFDDGNLSDWQSMKDAALSSAHVYSAPTSMHLNWHGGSVSQAFHTIAIGSPGLVEASARVWLPPVQEQYYWRQNAIASTSIYLYSGSSTANLYGGIELWPGETGYRLTLGWNNPGGTVSTVTAGTVLSPDTWGLLSLRMDTSSSTARLYLDGVEKCILTLDAQYFENCDEASLAGRLGSGAVPEPSGLIVLASALPFVGVLLRRRK